MQGKVTDDGFRTLGCREYRVEFSNSPRLAPADRHSEAGASILFATSWIKNHLSSGICQAIRAGTGRFLKNLGISGLAVAASVSLVDKVNAYVVPHKHITNYGCPIGDGSGGCLNEQEHYFPRGQLNFLRGNGGLMGYYLMTYHSSWWAEGDFNEGDNIEWVYDSLESQYQFLDVTLYKLLGGNYLLGPPCHPWWHGFRDFYWAKDSGKTIIGLSDDTVGRQWIDVWGKFYFFGERAKPDDQLNAYIGNIIVGQHTVSNEGWYNLRIFRDSPSTAHIDGAMPGDTMTFAALHRGRGKVYPVEILCGVPTWTFHGDSIRVDIDTVPEPSSIALFGLAALGVLPLRRKAHRRCEG